MGRAKPSANGSGTGGAQRREARGRVTRRTVEAAAGRAAGAIGRGAAARGDDGIGEEGGTTVVRGVVVGEAIAVDSVPIQLGGVWETLTLI